MKQGIPWSTMWERFKCIVPADQIPRISRDVVQRLSGLKCIVSAYRKAADQP